MGGGTDAYDWHMKSCRATACGLVMVVAASASEAAGAAAILGRAGTLAATPQATLLVAESLVSFSVQDVQAEPGKDAAIAIELPSPAELREVGAGEGTFMLVRNMPEGVSLSAGMATGRVWVLPLRDVAGLRLVSDPDINARFELGFHLIGSGNRILAEAAVAVDLRLRKTVATVATAAVPQAEEPKPEAARKALRPQIQAPQLPNQEETVLLARGKELQQQGSIVAARLIFEELTKRGSAAGALALARSYDPAYVTKSAASAPTPNMTEALKWYQRAAELGNTDAKSRLAEIGPGR